MNRIVSGLLLLAAGTAQAEIYQCTVDGSKVFSESPCGADARVVELKPLPPTSGQAVADSKEFTARVNKQVDRSQLEREIADAQADVESLQRRMDHEMAALQQKEAQVTNGPAAVSWRQAVASERQAVVLKYQSRIRAAQARVDLARDKLARLP